MKLNFLQQDILDRLIIHGQQSADTLAWQLDKQIADVEAALESLEDQSLVVTEEFGRDREAWPTEYRYFGGPITDFFRYQQTKGMEDGLQM